MTDSVEQDLYDFFFAPTDLDVHFKTEIAMGDVGRVDVTGILADGDQIEHLVSIEIQTSYFSGSEIRTEFTEYMESINNGEMPEVPQETRSIDYRSCIDKRLLPQLQQKVEVMRAHDGQCAAVVQDESYKNSVVMSRVDRVPQEEADLFWFVYEYTEDDPMYQLGQVDIIPTTIEDIREAIKNVSMAEYDTYKENVHNRLVSTDGGSEYHHDGSYQERLALWV